MPKNKNHIRPGKPHGLTLAETKKREKQVFDELVRAEAYKLLLQYSDNLVQQVMDAALVNTDYADDRDLVYAKEKIDQRLRTICGDKFEPWEVRYGRKKGPDDKG